MSITKNYQKTIEFKKNEEWAREFKINLVKIGAAEEDIFSLSNTKCASPDCENFLCHDLLYSDCYKGMCSVDCLHEK